MDMLCHVISVVLFLWNPLSITANCPQPFVQVDELCLYVSNHRGTGLRTWAGARAHCQSIGGDLLTSPPDTDKLKESLRKFSSNRRLHNGDCSGILCRSVDRWMGASRDAYDDWLWLSGSTNIPWRGTWPSQHSSRPACLVLAPGDGTYKDYGCDRWKAYICTPSESPASPKSDFGPTPSPGPDSSLENMKTAINNVPVVLPPVNTTGSCGHSTIKNVDERIANGLPSTSGQWPWLVHLSYFSDFHRDIINFGGTLINRKWVLTAGHCFRFLKEGKTVVVKIGFLDRTVQQPGSSTFSITHNNIITHEDFNAATLENDIALVHLPQEVTLSNVIQTICLGTDSQIPFGGKAFAAGWGLHKPSDTETPTILHHVELDVLPKESSCSSRTQHFICTFTEGKDTCSGDSGGPLMVQQDNWWYQVGIVSHGPRDCGQHHSPGVYTRVPNYLPFINSNIRF